MQIANIQSVARGTNYSKSVLMENGLLFYGLSPQRTKPAKAK